MGKQGDIAIEDYNSLLTEKIQDLCRHQNHCDLTIGLTQFITAIGLHSTAEKNDFLKWMKFDLDHIAIQLSQLNVKYKQENE